MRTWIGKDIISENCKAHSRVRHTFQWEIFNSIYLSWTGIYF